MLSEIGSDDSKNTSSASTIAARTFAAKSVPQRMPVPTTVSAGGAAMRRLGAALDAGDGVDEVGDAHESASVGAGPG